MDKALSIIFFMTLCLMGVQCEEPFTCGDEYPADHVNEGDIITDGCIDYITDTLTTETMMTVAIISSITVLETTTSTQVEVTSLPYSTYMTLISSENHYETMSLTSTTHVTITGETTITTVVGQTGQQTGQVTVTGPDSSVVITASQSDGEVTEYVTQTGISTVTVTTYSGFTTVSSCVPTTTIISTVTSAVPTATPVPGPTVAYNKQNCGVVSCPRGRNVIRVNGSPKTCYMTLYGTSLVSSTCTVDFCCTAESSTAGTVIRNTNCRSSGVECPAGTSMLVNGSGSTVPCLQTYRYGSLVDTTCNGTVCCSALSTTRVSCRTAVKCKVYRKDTATNYIMRCAVGDCSTTFCCSTV